MKQLNVFMSNTLIGTLRQHDDGALIFAYDHEWLTHDEAMPLSPELPLSEQLYGGDVVLAYFDNLLPEGNVREFIARAEQISPTNVFGLLERFGGDTAGALSLLPEGQQPFAQPHYLPVSLETIREWFVTSRGIPLSIAPEQARMSLSGVQDKMTVFIDQAGNIAIPLGTAPSSHIIKPSMDYLTHVPQTAINEALVMCLAKAIKLDVPDVRYIPELDAVLITRYDRTIGADGQLQRRHQNDLCQIIGLSSERKYESEGGPSLQACFSAVMQHSSQPALDKKRMIEWVIFNIAAGNMDSHAKNLSILVSDDGRPRLAPFYDMVCTTIYPNLSQRFAFKIGGENRPAWMMTRHWERFATEIEVKPQWVKTVRQAMCEQIEEALPQVVNSLRKIVHHADGLSMIDRVEREVLRSVKQMRMRIDDGDNRVVNPAQDPV